MLSFFRKPILLLIRLYQKTISPDHGFFKNKFPYGYCRFYPTCSEYSYQAIQMHGVIKGGVKTIWRVLRCNPWSKGGVDLPYRAMTFTGKVLRGMGRGGEVGAKTANLDVMLTKGLPPGLYECEVILENKKYRGLLFFGRNSLSDKICLEVHLLNFNGDIYGKEITVTTSRYLRAPKKLNSAGEIKKVVEEDLRQV